MITTGLAAGGNVGGHVVNADADIVSIIVGFPRVTDFLGWHC